MNKLLVITLLISLLSFGTQGFRVPRQAEGEEVAEEAAPEAPAEEAVFHEEAAHEEHEAVEEHMPEEHAPEVHAEEVAPEEPAAETVSEHHGPETHEHPDETESGPLTIVTEAVRAAWEKSVDTATSLIDSVKGWKLEEKAKSLYDETTNAVSTYSGILQDQVYHLIYTQ